MRVLLIVFIYIVTSGCLLGMMKNVEEIKCGKATRINTEDIVRSLLWPMALGSYMTLNGDRDVDLCKVRGSVVK